MARKPRLDYPGAVHHVMNRGASHQTTFETTQDRQDFTGLWAEAVVRFGLVVLAYAWMGNHYHALVVSPDGQLSESMRYIGFMYTQRFNRRHQRDGALFRGRFHSVLIDSDTYLERVARYIERNPLEAGLADADSLVQYPWSSLQHYVNPSYGDWVSTEPLTRRLGSPYAYLQHVLSDHSDDEIYTFYKRLERDNVVLGNKEFVGTLPVEARDLGPIAGVPEVSVEEIEHALTCLGSPIGLHPNARIVAVTLGQSLARATRTELAERYHFPSAQSISSALHRKRHHPDVVSLCEAVLTYLGRSSLGLPEAS